MPELIALLDRGGTIVEVNHAWRQAATRNDAPGPVATGAGLNYLDVCLRATGEGAEDARRCHAGLEAVLRGSLAEYEQEYPCPSATGERWFLLRGLPLASPMGGVLVVHSEITERERLARTLRRANRALQMRSECTRVLLRAKDETEALSQVCQVIIDTGGYRFAWVGFARKDGTKSVQPVAQAGRGDGYLESLVITWGDDEYGRGPTGSAIRAGAPCVARDIRTDAHYAPWRDEAIKRGYGSSVALPLDAGSVFGALNIYAIEADAFSQEEVGLLQELAGDLSVGISGLRARAERDRAEEALSRSEDKFRKVFHALPDGCVITRIGDGVILDASEGFAETTGFSPDEAVGKTALELSLWREPAERNRMVAALQARGEVRGIEFEYARKDGSTSVGLLSAKAMIIDGEPCILTIVRDIAERKRMEAALREGARQRAAILDSVPDIAWLKDRDGRFIAVNEPFARVCGWTPDALAGRTDFDIWPVELAQRYVADDDEVMRTGKRRRVEERLVNAAGEEAWIETIKTPISDERGEVVGTSGIARDVTERRRIADALLREKEFSDTVINSLPGIFYMLDESGSLVRWNKRLAEISGVEFDEIGRMGALDFLHEEDRPRVDGAIRTVFEAGHADVEARLRTKAGLDIDHVFVGNRTRIEGKSYLVGVGIDITDRRRAERALEQAHERLRLALHAARAGAWSWDRVTNQAVWSEENYQVMGLEPDSCEACYENWLARVHPEDRTAAEAAVGEAMARKSDLNVEFRVMWADGSVHWINDVGRMVLDAKGEPAGMYGIQVDITERKLAAEAIARSEGNLRVTLRSIGDAVIATDGEGRVTLMNPVAQALTGWPEDEARGRPLDEVFRIVNEETRASVESPVRRVLSEGTIVGLANHTLLIDRHGVERPIADSGAPIRLFSESRILGVVLVFRDQTSERQTRRRLEEEEARYRSLVQQVPAVIYVAALDSASSSVFVSAHVEDILGFTVQEYESDPGLWLRSLHPEDRERVLAELERTRAAQEGFAAEYRMFAKDGRELWISDRATIVVNSAGNPSFLQGLMFDVTDRKRAEQEVRRLNDELEQRVQERTAELAAAVRELESFSYSVSHDLRAPLRAINGYSNLLLDAEKDRMGEDGKALLQRVMVNTLKMERLIDDILQYSRAGRLPFDLGEVSLDALVRGIARDLSETYPGAQIVIRGLPRVRGDRTMLRQIYANLIGNALKFSSGRHPALIEVGVRNQNGQTVFFVKDNGVGFDMRYADKLFGMFQRMHRDTEFPGTGVGLAVVKRLVERHHGHVWAEAEPDHGANFCFTLAQ